MCDWIDNAVTVQMTAPATRLYGYMHLPCRVELNSTVPSTVHRRRPSLIEFTGERVVPGQVDADLWNEHLARYAFAAPLAPGKRVLDAGCGSGYGSAELARTARTVVGARSLRMTPCTHACRSPTRAPT